MRRLLAVGLPVVLQVGALWAPHVHAHLDAHHDDHHDAATVHAHVAGHRAHGPADAGHHTPEYVASGGSRTRFVMTSDDEPEQTTRLQIFVAVTAVAVASPALPPARFGLAPPPDSEMRQPPDVVRSHGPPGDRLTESRAPPLPSVLI